VTTKTRAALRRRSASSSRSASESGPQYSVPGLAYVKVPARASLDTTEQDTARRGCTLTAQKGSQEL
jgi:hypothetical protein